MYVQQILLALSMLTHAIEVRNPTMKISKRRICIFVYQTYIHNFTKLLNKLYTNMNTEHKICVQI